MRISVSYIVTRLYSANVIYVRRCYVARQPFSASSYHYTALMR
jgi:hypothetical protein